MKKVRFFLISQGSFNPNIMSLCQKMYPVDWLLNQASHMKETFDDIKKTMLEKQQKYHSNFIKMSRNDEENVRADIMQDMFVLHILEHRIALHKEYAPVKYQDLIDRLSDELRITKHFS